MLNHIFLGLALDFSIKRASLCGVLQSHPAPLEMGRTKQPDSRVQLEDIWATETHEEKSPENPARPLFTLETARGECALIG